MLQNINKSFPTNLEQFWISIYKDIFGLAWSVAESQDNNLLNIKQ